MFMKLLIILSSLVLFACSQNKSLKVDDDTLQGIDYGNWCNNKPNNSTPVDTLDATCMAYTQCTRYFGAKDKECQQTLKKKVTQLQASSVNNSDKVAGALSVIKARL